MLLGYNTNGLAHHDLFDAVGELAQIGYRSVAITIDHTALPPYGRYNASGSGGCGGCWAPGHALGDRDRRAVPLGPGRETRAHVDYGQPPGPRPPCRLLSLCGRLRRGIGSDCVSLWSGVLRGGTSPGRRPWTGWSKGSGKCCRMPRRRAWRSVSSPSRECSSTRWAVPGVARENRRAGAPPDARRGPSPLPGRDAHRRGHSPLGAAAGQRSPRGHVRRGPRALDVRRGGDRFSAGVSRPGRGRLPGGVHVELSRHSHEGPAAARRAMEYLSQVCE